jgi:hypothetical protein
MYVRVARFEGVDPARVDEQIAELRQQLESSRGGEPPPGAPEAYRVLMETVVRFVELVDRENGRFLALSYCETEDDLRRANEALDAMSPGAGGGRRTSVEMYEVAIDSSFA